MENFLLWEVDLFDLGKKGCRCYSFISLGMKMKVEDLMHPQMSPTDFRLTMVMQTQRTANVLGMLAFMCIWLGQLPVVQEVTRVRRRKKRGGMNSVRHHFEVKAELRGEKAHGPLLLIPRRLKKGYYERWRGRCNGEPRRIVVEEYYLFKLRQWMGRDVWLAFRDNFDVYRLQVVAKR